MAISTPSTWTLNFRGKEWLESELARWTTRSQGLYGTDLTAAQMYMEAVRLELGQRTADYGSDGSLWAAALAGLRAPFEALGGAGGAGAPGLASDISDTVGSGVKIVGRTVDKYIGWVIICLVIVGGLFVWTRFKK